LASASLLETKNSPIPKAVLRISADPAATMNPHRNTPSISRGGSFS
jgi:hypothetical protein